MNTIEFDKEIFGRRLKLLMDDYGDTTYTVAEYLGMQPSTISRYSNGVYVPKAPTLQALAQRYSVNPAWLMGHNVKKYLYDDMYEGLQGYKKIPVLGTVAAGMPIYAEGNIEDYVVVEEREDVDFALKVKGDSMINARIFNGDLVFVKKQPTVDDGEIAVVVIDGDATVKRVYRNGKVMMLHAENPTYKDIVCKKSDGLTVQIIGKVKFVKGDVI